MNVYYLLTALVVIGCILVFTARNQWILGGTAAITTGFAAALSEQLHLNYWIGFIAFWSWVLVARVILPRFLKRIR